MSAQPASTPALLLSAGAGAVAASSLLLAWTWWQQRQVGDPLHARHASPASASSAAGCSHHGSRSAAASSHSLHPPSAGRPRGDSTVSVSRSRAQRRSSDPDDAERRAYEPSFSRSSYLEDREYEGDHHRLPEDDEDEARDADAAAAEARDRVEEGQEEDDTDEDGAGDDADIMYMCPHCSNYINPHELVVVPLDEDGHAQGIDGDDDDAADGQTALTRAHSATAARILSASERLQIHSSLRDSLKQIFASVDEDGDGIISREEMARFLKKLGLDGERELAFLNIVGGDSVQGTVPAPGSAAIGSPEHAKLEKRGSKSGKAGGSGSNSGKASLSNSRNGSLSAAAASAATAAVAAANANAALASTSGLKVGINFRQFVERFQDTLEGMDQLNVEDALSEDANGIQTNPVVLDPGAAFQPASTSSSSSATSTSSSVPARSASSSPSASPLLADASLTLTTPTKSASKLTVNTTASQPPAGSVLQVPSSSPSQQQQPAPLLSPSSSSSNSSAIPSLFSPSTTQALSALSSPSIRVFLGGACGKTVWRAEQAIPLLQAHGISFYDPHVKDWSPKLLALEGLMKAWCKILLFVIGKDTRALASMIEVASLIAAGRRVVLVIENVEPGVEIEGQVPSASELKDLNRARAYLRDVAGTYDIPVHGSVDEGVKAIIAMEEEERREVRARVQLLREHSASAGARAAAAAALAASSDAPSSSAGTLGVPSSADRAHRASVSRPRGRSSILLNGTALASLSSASSSPLLPPHMLSPSSAGGGHHHSLSGHFSSPGTASATAGGGGGGSHRKLHSVSMAGGGALSSATLPPPNLGLPVPGTSGAGSLPGSPQNKHARAKSKM